jgi:hypothetical protein
MSEISPNKRRILEIKR